MSIRVIRVQRGLITAIPNEPQNSALALARAGIELALAVATNSDLAPVARKARKAFTRLYNMLEIMEDE